jgi:hypothetical protein
MSTHIANSSTQTWSSPPLLEDEEEVLVEVEVPPPEVLVEVEVPPPEVEVLVEVDVEVLVEVLPPDDVEVEVDVLPQGCTVTSQFAPKLLVWKVCAPVPSHESVGAK